MAAPPRILAIMGSGETAPTMVSTHQALFDRLGPDTSAVLLETPYGFQENADEISERAVAYFARNVGRTITPVRMRTATDAGQADGIARLQTAGYVFAGPGSPTYALAQWRGTALPGIVADKLRTGGAVVFASAAACGLGRVAVPVYEIYKVGAAPHWVPGLDLLAAAGIDAAVIPHFDNAEGGTHDTRFCYLGARRLAQMEAQLDAGTVVLGVDEHTALVCDLEDRTAHVRGRGVVTVRRDGRQVRAVPAGETLPLDDLVAAAPSAPAGARSAVDGASAGDGGPKGGDVPTDHAEPPADDGSEAGPASLDEHARAASQAFDAAIARRDGAAAAAVIVDLDAAIVAWSADTLQSDEADRARQVLHGLVSRLGACADEGLVDPTARIAPLVEAVLAARSDARGRGDYATADVLRDAVADAGVEVRDGADGSTWQLARP